jgi:hypothetical protein
MTDEQDPLIGRHTPRKMMCDNTNREARMPLKKSSAMRSVGLVAAVCGVIASTPAAAMAADSTEDCTYQQTTKAFSFLGDQNDYFLAPGGDFEGELTWATSGDVQQKSAVLSLLGRKVVDLGVGASVQSADVCVDATRRHLRFAVKAPWQGKLRIEAHDAAGNITALRTIDAAEQRGLVSQLGWTATPEVPLASALSVASGSRDVTLKITAESGSWDVDSVNIDPYRG